MRQRVPSCIKVLATHHVESAVGELLDSEDFSATILAALQMLAKEEPLLLRLLNHLTETLDNSESAPWAGTDDNPWTALHCQRILIGVAINRCFPQLLGTFFLLRIGTTTEGSGYVINS